MEKIMKIKQFEVENQFVLENDEQLIFQSYDSIIAVYNKKSHEITLGRDWDYSKTTSKYLYKFLDTYFCYDYKLQDELIAIIKKLTNTKNKKQLIREAIKNNVIKYDGEM